MELSGHSGEVFCAKFDPNGNYIASGSMDRSISEFGAGNWLMGGLLTIGSVVEDFWRLRKLRHIDGSQGRDSGSSLVAGLENTVFCIRGYAFGKLGFGNWNEDTKTYWTRGSHQQHGHQQERRGTSDQWL